MNTMQGSCLRLVVLVAVVVVVAIVVVVVVFAEVLVLMVGAVAKGFVWVFKSCKICCLC
jgi:hypothetical protein